MNARLALRAVFLCLLGLSPLAGMAQQVSALLVQPADASVGEPVRIRVYLESADASAACGLRVALGDGSFRRLRADMMDMPVSFSHTYSRGGEFTIRAVGDVYKRGLWTALACDGAKDAAITVVDVAAERRRQAAEMEAQQRAEREAAERKRELEAQERLLREREAEVREALLAQQRAEREAAERKRELEAQERSLREREAEVRRLAEQRERELAERAETLLWMELQAAAREKALQAREKAARQPARTAGPAPSGQASSGSSGKRSQKSAKPSGSAPRGTLDAF
jgi:hypothetical protein